MPHRRARRARARASARHPAARRSRRGPPGRSTRGAPAPTCSASRLGHRQQPNGPLDAKQRGRPCRARVQTLIFESRAVRSSRRVPTNPAPIHTSHAAAPSRPHRHDSSRAEAADCDRGPTPESADVQPACTARPGGRDATADDAQPGELMPIRAWRSPPTRASRTWQPATTTSPQTPSSTRCGAMRPTRDAESRQAQTQLPAGWWP